jgi:hypothetical protein
MAAALAIVAVVVAWDWLDRHSQTRLVSPEPLATLATQSLTEAHPTMDEDQQILEQKARLALAQLQASTAPTFPHSAESSSQATSTPPIAPQAAPESKTAAPKTPEPSFQPLAEPQSVSTSAPVATAESQPHKVTPAPVRFVNFDLPTPLEEEEEKSE